MKYVDQALILAAGKGTRLKDKNSCKALINIKGKPLICNVIDNLRCCGINKFFVVIYAKDDFSIVEQYYENKSISLFLIKDYERRGSLWSFMLASNYVEIPFICADCDLITRNENMINMFAEGITCISDNNYDGVVARVTNPSRDDVDMLIVDNNMAKGLDKKGAIQSVRGGYIYIWDFQDVFLEANYLIEQSIYSFSKYVDYILKNYKIGVMNIIDLWDVDCPEDISYTNNFL